MNARHVETFLLHAVYATRNERTTRLSVVVDAGAFVLVKQTEEGAPSDWSEPVVIGVFETIDEAKDEAQRLGREINPVHVAVRDRKQQTMLRLKIRVDLIGEARTYGQVRKSIADALSRFHHRGESPKTDDSAVLVDQKGYAIGRLQVIEVPRHLS